MGVAEVDARHLLGVRAQQLWQELHAQLDTLKTLERDLSRSGFIGSWGGRRAPDARPYRQTHSTLAG